MTCFLIDLAATVYFPVLSLPRFPWLLKKVKRRLNTGTVQSTACNFSDSSRNFDLALPRCRLLFELDDEDYGLGLDGSGCLVRC